jgi:pyruvate/2-oxoglutarate dehydrogenase complex dihydrolipoamide acyltransferase (E2) component
VNKPKSRSSALAGRAQTGRARRKDRAATDDAIAISYDHRVIDGGTAARFTVDLLEAFANIKEAEVKI